MGMLLKVPRNASAEGCQGHKLMRGRPITDEEFERMLAALPKIRKHNAPLWTHYLTGLWLSGLRLEESTILSWDDESPFPSTCRVGIPDCASTPRQRKAKGPPAADDA